MAKAFDGLRVIDFSQVLAGPMATMQLALLGADVIKIEQPGSGDQSRGLMVEEGKFTELNTSPMFLGINPGKRSVALDLKNPAAADIVRRLLADADVVMENYRAGVITRLGFGYEAVKEIRPDIVYCSISGYGQEGPQANVGAFDGAIQAASGMMSVTGTPETGPIRAGFFAVDMATGVTAAFAIASALYRRQSTGEGQYLDVSMNDTALTMINTHVSNYLNNGVVPELFGNTSPTAQGTANTWPTKDGFISIAVVTDRLAEKLCRGLGHPEWFEEERYRTREARILYREQIDKEIRDVLATQTSAYWLERIGAEGAPISPVNALPEAVSLDQLAHRDVLIKQEAPQGLDSEITIAGAGFMASSDGPGHHQPAPALGQHTEEVLQELGYSKEEIEGLRQAGAI
jgi:formyl-CoA transferase